jgi:hypothetical protein
MRRKIAYCCAAQKGPRPMSPIVPRMLRSAISAFKRVFDAL